MVIFNYFPMYGVMIAFKDYRTNLGILKSPWIGLSNFRRFVSYPAFWTMIRNTLSISLYSLATQPLGVMLALMINSLRSVKYKKTVQMISYAPYFLSTMVLCGMITLFFDKEAGIINVIIDKLGGTRRNFLSEADLFNDIFVWSGVWQKIGWGTILYIAALSGISPELHEAAYIDGASKLQITWHIDLPGIAPTVIICFIMATGNILSVGFEKVYLLQNSLNLSKSQVISTYSYEVGIGQAQFSYSSAIGLFNNIINVTILMLTNAISNKVSGMGMF